MKRPIPVIFALILAGTILNSSAQIPDDTDGRLYRLCKTWGYFKYFSQHQCELKWDTLLYSTVTEVLAAGTNEEFNQAMMTMFNKVGNNTLSPLQGPEPDTNLNFDNSWIDDPVFSQDVQDFLETFSLYIVPNSSSCLVKLNDYSNPNYISFIDFQDDPLSMFLDLTQETDRLTYMFYYWNVINYFFPYRYLMDQPWDSTLVEFIPMFRQADGVLGFHITFLQFVTRINDSHGYTDSGALSTYFWGGTYLPYLYLTRVDTLCVVTKVQNIPEVSPGDILIEMKGIPIQEIEDSLAAYIPASTPAGLYRDMYNRMLRGAYNSTLDMTFLDADNNTYTVSPARSASYSNWYTWAHDPGVSSSYFITSCDYGYVNMDLLQPDEVPAMYEALKDAPAIIFDLRNYPNGTLWDLGPLFFPGPIISAIYHDPALVSQWDPDYYYMPGWYYIGNDYYNLGNWSNPDAYEGDVFILVNEQTQSQAEYTCQYLSHHPNATVFGTQTAGADGNVSYLSMPGGIVSYFTALGWYYGDGYQQQRNGVKIDTIVSPTLEGIRQGKDEILLAALDCLTGMDVIDVASAYVSVYPNPAEGYVYISFGFPADRLEIFDINGRQVFSKELTSRDNEPVGFSTMAFTAGVYFLRISGRHQVAVEKLAIRR